jgi:hypothetical protein
MRPHFAVKASNPTRKVKVTHGPNNYVVKAAAREERRGVNLYVFWSSAVGEGGGRAARFYGRSVLL